TVCIHKMFASSAAAKGTANSSAVRLAQANGRTRRSSLDTTGTGWRAEDATKPPVARAATTQAASTREEDQPQLGPSTIPSDRAPIAITRRAAPRRSGLRSALVSRDSWTHSHDPSSARTPTGTLTRNTQCQETSTSTPPTAGPKAAATAPAAAQMRTHVV